MCQFPSLCYGTPVREHIFSNRNGRLWPTGAIRRRFSPRFVRPLSGCCGHPAWETQGGSREMRGASATPIADIRVWLRRTAV